MSSSFARLNPSVRTICSSVSSSSSSVTSRVLATSSRRYSFAAMKQRPAEIPSSAGAESSARVESRAVYADAEEEAGVMLGDRIPSLAFGWDRRKTSKEHSKESFIRFQDRLDYSAMRSPSPKFAEHLNKLFPELQFPIELGRRILTHSSHPAAIYGHNAGLSFMGRRVVSAYLSLLLSSSPNLKPSDDVEAIVAQALNTYVLGEHIGSKWGLGKVMKWTPTLKADKAKNADNVLLKSVGLYKVQGDAVAAIIGGIYEQFGASAAHRAFCTRVLPHILLSKPHTGLPEAFHGDARAACNRFGGMQGPLVVDHSSLPSLPKEPKKVQGIAHAPPKVDDIPLSD